MFRITSILILSLFILSCAPGYELRKQVDNLDKKNLLVMQPFQMHEIRGITDPEEIFNGNMFIGSIEFSGCIITNTEHNNIRQSNSRKYQMQTEFFKQAGQTFSSAIEETLSDNKYSFKNYIPRADNELTPLNLITYEVITDRKKYEEDGSDNINLPRLIYKAVALNENAMKLLSGYHCDYVIIPVIEYYYGHNGGWFNDQEWGCSAGVRMAFQILIFDLSTGQAVLSFRNEERYIVPMQYRISQLEISRELLPLEEEMTEKIKDAL